MKFSYPGSQDWRWLKKNMGKNYHYSFRGTPTHTSAFGHPFIARWTQNQD